MKLRQTIIARMHNLEGLYPQCSEESRAICKMMHEECLRFLGKL